MGVVFVVFGLPLIQPGDRQFLGAYSSQSRAQRFIDEQLPEVQENLVIAEIVLDQHPPSDDFWNIPSE